MDVELDYLVSELHAPVDAEVASVQPGLAINADETHFEGDVYFDTVFHDDRADLEPDSGDGFQYESSGIEDFLDFDYMFCTDCDASGPTVSCVSSCSARAPAASSCTENVAPAGSVASVMTESDGGFVPRTGRGGLRTPACAPRAGIDFFLNDSDLFEQVCSTSSLRAAADYECGCHRDGGLSCASSVKQHEQVNITACNSEAFTAYPLFQNTSLFPFHPHCFLSHLIAITCLFNCIRSQITAITPQMKVAPVQSP